MVEVTNDGDQSPEFTKLSVVFYKGGHVIHIPEIFLIVILRVY